MKTSSVVRILGVLVIAAAALLIALFFAEIKQFLARFLEWVHGIGFWGPVLIAAAYVVACILLVPGSILSLAAGFLFGVVVGTITVSIGSTLGATAAFWTGRTLARQWVAKRVASSPRFRALDEAVEQNGFRIVLLTRLSPVLPFNLLNYAFGLTRISPRDYVLGSWIGMLPGTIMYIYLGSTARDLAGLVSGSEVHNPGGRLFFWIGLAATVAVTFVLARLARKALAQKRGQSPYT